MRSVSYSRATGQWSVLGSERPGGNDGGLTLSVDELADVAAVDLKNALLRRLDDLNSGMEIAYISPARPDDLDEETLIETVWFEVDDGGGLFVALTCWMQWPESGDDGEAVERLRTLLQPLLKDRRSSIVDSRVDYDWSSRESVAITLRVSVPWRGRAISALYRVGEDITRLCDAATSGNISRETAADLVRGGRAEILVGQPEGNWLDVKAQEYDLTETRGKISLAQAAARFANAEDGGLIVIGMKARKVPGGEVIQSVSGIVPRQHDTVARYLRILDQHLYPPIFGIRVDTIELGDAGHYLIVLDIPAQPEEQKPFLVHGAIMTDGSTEGSFISIVQRRGEASIPISAPMIHASIAAGRALLRSGL